MPAPPTFRTTRAKPAPRPRGSAARRDRASEAKAPEGGRNPLWATHQVEGSFHYFHRPRGKRRPEEGERRSPGTWRVTAGERDAAAATVAPLRAPGASSGRRGSNNPTTSSSGAAPRARPPRRGHARVTTSHAAGSRWEGGQGVGGAQGRRGTDKRTLSRGPSFLSREACLQLPHTSREEVQPCCWNLSKSG